MRKLKTVQYLLKLRAECGEARAAFLEAKEAGKLSVSQELRAGKASDGSEWLMIRAKAVSAVSVVIALVVQLVGLYVSPEALEFLTPEAIDAISTTVVSIGFLWGSLDSVRSVESIGVLPKSKA